MRVFTLDVGSGTQDFLYCDIGNFRIENSGIYKSICKSISIKMVLPSPTRIVAKKIKMSKDIFLCGYTMGGGACKKAVLNHIKKGYKVFSTEKAALTFFLII